MSLDTPAAVREALAGERYLADRGLSIAVCLAASLEQPLLLEGEAGVGKTEVAKALAGATGARRIGLAHTRTQVEELARIVPVVEGVVQVDALVALQPDQARACEPGQRLRHLGLAHTGLTLEEQRLLEGGRKVDGSGEAPVSEVSLACQSLLDGCGAVETQTLTASSSALRVRTRAR